MWVAVAEWSTTVSALYFIYIFLLLSVRTVCIDVCMYDSGSFRIDIRITEHKSRYNLLPPVSHTLLHSDLMMLFTDYSTYSTTEYTHHR